MKNKTRWIILGTTLAVLALLTAITVQAAPSTPSAPVGTGFTYQGKLEDESGPVSASCDMEFRLYSHATNPTQVGSTIATTVPISNGLFTVELDFGASAFDGQARWLGIQVSCPGDSGFTDLGRQALTAAPYAHYALKAPWSGLAGVPAGFADGVDDNTTYAAACPPGEVISSLYADGTADCTIDYNTTYDAGTGLSLAGTTFSADTTYLQKRLSTCPAGLVLVNVSASGDTVCAAPDTTHDHWGQTWTGSGTGLILSGGSTGVYGSGSAEGISGYSSSGIGVSGVGPTHGIYGEGDLYGVYGLSYFGDGAGVAASNSDSTGVALSIEQGAFRVAGAGEDTDTTVFIHKVSTGTGGNICSGQNYATVIDHPLLNNQPNAILIITPNYGPASSGTLVRQPYGVYYDDTNQCGFGTGRWVIYGYGVSPASPLALANNQLFNVMVVLP